MQKIRAGEKAPAYGRFVTFLTLLLAVSVALNVGLSYQIRKFMVQKKAQLAMIEARRLKLGAQVPPLHVKRLGYDAAETINYTGADRSTVLYVLSPTCGWCAKNELSIKHLRVFRKTSG